MSVQLRTEPHLSDWLVRNRNFMLLWAAYGISAFGDHLSEMALLQERGGLNRPDVTRVQALLGFGFFLPFVLFAPLAGWWADRFSRKWTMIATDILRAGVMISLIIAVPWLARWLEPLGLGDYAVVLPLGVTGALAAFFSPARQALVPVLIRQDQLVRANAMISALGTIGAILSGVAGGYLVRLSELGHLRLTWNYKLDALTFLASATLLACIHLRATRAVPHPKLEGVWAPLVHGFRYVRQHRRIWQLILLLTVFWAAAGVVFSVVPAIVRDVFGGTIAHAGMYRGLIVAGLATGSAVMTLVGPTMPLQLAVLSALAGGAFWLFALDATYLFKLGKLATAVGMFGMGGAGAALLVTGNAAIQRFVPDSRRGRIFGVSDLCTTGAMAAATGALGLPNIPNLDRYIPWLLGATGAGLCVATWLAWRSYRRGDPHRAIVSFLWLMVRFYVRFWCRVKRVGPCTVPQRGPVIVAANHTAGVDPLAILTTCTHRITSFIVAREYYDAPIAGWFMRLVNCIPINRAHPGKTFLAACLRLLRDGGCLGIFPQGTYAAPTEAEPEPKSGIGVIALRTGATVIPCHISGARYSYNPFAALFQRHRMQIRYGPPIDLAAFHDQERDPETPDRVSALIWQRIRALAPASTPVHTH